MRIEAFPLLTYPTTGGRALVNAREMFMHQQGAIDHPPVRAIFTKHASGGCVPICAAEITQVGHTRTVNWIYLMHGHYANYPVNIAAHAANPANVYVCMLVYNLHHSFYAAANMQDTYFNSLDPNGVIPDANALLIYGDHTALAITTQAMIAVGTPLTVW